MTNVRVRTGQRDEWLTLSFPFDREVIDIVKQASSGLREYDPGTKSWSVHESVGEQVIDALHAAGHQVLTGDEPAPKPYDQSIDGFFAEIPESERAYITAKANEILEGIPAHLQHRVFRALGRRLHPELYKGHQ